MSIGVRTVAVNAAFLQEIKEDNHQLRELLLCARDLMSRAVASRKCAQSVADVLGELRDQLAMHFALEDAYGYFEDAVLHDPRLTQRAITLHGQHDGLFRSIQELAEWAENIAYDHNALHKMRSLSRAYLEFHGQFQAHEQRENELIMDAFDDDIGVGD